MKYAVIIFSILVLAVGGLWLSASPAEDDEIESTVADTAVTNDTVDVDVNTTQPANSNVLTAVLEGINELRYVEFSSESLEATTDTNQVVFFHAPWCVYCVQFENSVLHGEIPDNITFLKADYDSSFDLKRRYGVNFSSALVSVDSAGELLDIWHTTETPTISDVVARLGI